MEQDEEDEEEVMEFGAVSMGYEHDNILRVSKVMNFRCVQYSTIRIFVWYNIHPLSMHTYLHYTLEKLISLIQLPYDVAMCYCMMPYTPLMSHLSTLNIILLAVDFVVDPLTSEYIHESC